MGRLAQLCLLLLLWPASLLAADSKPTEYEVKAAFLFNFARFVEWPADSAQDTLHICVVGKDPFGAAFDRVLGATAGARPLAVHRVTIDKLPGTCHILFVSSAARQQLGSILGRVRDQPMLTVSDAPDFATEGGMIGFVTRDNKIRFQINPAAASRAGLRLSAKLLRLAEIIDGEGR